MMGVSMTDECVIDHIRGRLDGVDAETATDFDRHDLGDSVQSESGCL